MANLSMEDSLSTETIAQIMSIEHFWHKKETAFSWWDIFKNTDKKEELVGIMIDVINKLFGEHVVKKKIEEFDDYVNQASIISDCLTSNKN